MTPPRALEALEWGVVAGRAAPSRVWLTWGEACDPGGSRWGSGAFGWGAVVARLVVGACVPDKGPRRSPWVSGWVWAPGSGVMYARGNGALVALGALVLDVDGAEGVGVGDVAGSGAWRSRLRAALGPEVRAVVWPSRSWGAKPGPRSKALVPLHPPLPLEVAREWLPEVAQALQALGVEVDPACLGLGQNQDTPSLPRAARAPEVEVWPAEPEGVPLGAWSAAPPEVWPGVALDPDNPSGPLPSALAARARASALGLEPEWSPPDFSGALDAPEGLAPQAQRPRVAPHASPPGGPNHERALERARARLGAWGRATVDRETDKLRASHFHGSRTASGFRVGVWLGRLALTHVGPLGAALERAEVDAVVDAEVRALGLPKDETRRLLDAIRRKVAKRGALLDLPPNLAGILRDFYGDGGR